MENNKHIPELRFPEFKGEWEEKRTKQIAPLQRGFDLPTSDVIDGNYPVVYSNGILRHHNQYKVKAPGIVTGRSGTIGKVTYVEKDFWPHNTSLWVTDFYDNKPKFIYYFYLNFKLNRYNAGSTVPTLNRNDVHFVKKRIPTPPEQQKIASFLTAIDRRIDLLQQKKEALEDYKKGVMQKLFPPKDGQAPEIRFKDKNGNDFKDWEEKKLGEVFSSIKGKGLSKKDIVDEGKNQCILYGELYTTYTEIIEDVASTTNISDGVKSKIGDLLIPCSTTTTGIDLANVTALNQEGILLGGDITVLRTDREISNLFFAYYLSNYKKNDLAKYGQGITIVHLYYNHFKEMKIEFPCNAEQQKIAQFLSALDTSIKGIEQKIEATQTYKKGLLQKMFV